MNGGGEKLTKKQNTVLCYDGDGRTKEEKEKDTERKNPYALCTWSLYNRDGKQRKKQIDCGKYYKYEKYNSTYSIKEYPKRNRIKITGKKKQELIEELYKKEKK